MTKPPNTPRPTKPPLLQATEGDWIIDSVPISHEKLVGRVVIAWSKLEAEMAGLIWFCLDLDMCRGRVLTTRMECTALIKTLRAIGGFKLSEPDQSILSQILSEIDLRREDRNIIVHGDWGSDKNGLPIALSMRPKSDGPNLAVGETFPPGRMLVILRDIDRLKAEILSLMAKLGVSRYRPGQPPTSS